MCIDVDYDGDEANQRRSAFGVGVMLGDTAVNAFNSINSMAQHHVSLSTIDSEAEYVAMAQGSKTVLFRRGVLVFLLHVPKLVERLIDFL